MATRLNWTEQSIIDFKSISEYIAKDSGKYAKLTIAKIRKSAQNLKLHKELGRMVPEANNPIIREIIIGNYRLIYKIISSNRLDILTVHH